MKSKIVKILSIIMFTSLMILILGNCVNATVTVDGTKYWTKYDLSWMGYPGYGYINVKGTAEDYAGNYYCIKHNYQLTEYLGEEDSLLYSETKEYVIHDAEHEIPVVLSAMSQGVFKKYIENGSKWHIQIGDNFFGNDGRPGVWGLRLYPGEWKTIQNTQEAALYAFADKIYDGVNNPSGDVQNAIWQYLAPSQGYSNYHQTELYRASEYYPTWLNNKADLKSTDASAKSRILGSDYIVGPFKVEYNTETIGKVVFSELQSYTITDQNGNAISGATVTNSNGANLGTIPNGQEFYVRFPYNPGITEVKISVSVKYINNVSARYQDVETRSQLFKIQWTNPTVKVASYNTTHNSDYCKKEVKGKTTSDENGYPKCNAGCDRFSTHFQTYKASMDGKVMKQGEEKPGKYQNMRRFTGDIDYATATTTMSAPIESQEMDIEGDVWEDIPQGKDQLFNGSKDENDKLLSGIEVRLYNKDGTLANVRYGTNPTLTDEKGHYAFKGVTPTNKYYVVFTYDGMIYTNTYGAGVPEYNTNNWNNSSKGSEIVSERNDLNKRFVTIGSYPSSYKAEPIFSGSYLINGYNKIFALNDNKLVQEYKDKVTKQLKNYLSINNGLEDSQYINSIYIPIINSVSEDKKTEAKQVLQYIWDCRVRAYAGDESEQDGKTERAGGKYYPYYDNFALRDNNGNRLTATNSTTNWQGYRIIYNGQLHINLGIIKRPTADLELTEDLDHSVVSINGQDETYTYPTFSKKEVKVNASDAMITQNLATDDYDYKVDSSTLSSDLSNQAAYPVNYAPIEVYVTYRINIKNNSSIPTGINEVVTYIDSKYFSYSDTYKTTGGMTIKGIDGSFLYPDSNTNYEEKNLNQYSSNSFGLKVSASSKYGIESETGKFMGTDLYISFDENVILEQDRVLALYITYRLGENSTTNAKFNCTYVSTQSDGANHAYAIIQDLFAINNKKIYIYSRAEVNGYSTFFKMDTDASATRTKYNEFYDEKYSSALSAGAKYRAAGVLDANSMPGNLDPVQYNAYETNYEKTENDWDRASVYVLSDAGFRTMMGNAWETVNQKANEWTESGSYAKYDSAYSIEGLTVELIEIKDGKEYIRATTSTAGDGSYSFTNYIPGIYTIRFIYGDKAQYDSTQYSKYTNFNFNGIDYKCAYNGEFYQSAKANPKTNDNKYWYATEEGDRYSDAYDEVNIRKAVNESLQTYKYDDVVSLLKHPTDYMVYAYTSPLDIEVEKATESTTSQNPAYTVSNVDFALTPRTDTKLSINKEVAHVKLILQNGTVQFDADTATIREQGVPGVLQAAQGYDVNISMSSELVNGATLEITYRVTVTNDSAEDTVTYYKDSSGNIIALGLYKEDPTKVVYYEEGQMRTYTNSFGRNSDSTWVSYSNAGATAMKAYDASKTQVVETTTRAQTVADFVSDNLNFTKVNYDRATINNGWDLYTGSKEDFENTYYKQDSSESGLSPQIPTEMNSEEIYNSSVIVLANGDNKLITTDLKHGESVSEDIVLSKVISVNSDSTDKKSYNNKVRVLAINNSVSRVQNMIDKLSDTSEHVIVSDPTGIGNKYLGIVLTLVVASIIAGGVVLIKKFTIRTK